MAWGTDHPGGPYKNHALSSKIRMEAAAKAQVQRFLRPESGYGRKRGETLSITRIRQLPLAGRVSEDQELPSMRPGIDTKSVTVSEWGAKIPLTEFEVDLTHYELDPQFRKALRDQMDLTMDKMAADALKLTLIKYIPTLGGGAFDTDGTPSTLADANMSVNDIRRIRDFLFDDMKAPTINGKYYGILSTTAARGIKNDPEYKDWHAPTSPMPFMTGVMKDIEDVVLIESNHRDSLDNLAGTSTVCGEAIFFGDDPGFQAVVRDPELRIAQAKSDLNRFWDIGWVGTLEASLTWDLASHSRVIHVTSS